MASTSTKLNGAFEKILTANLQRALDFQKYAEAKNAALLTIASAWVIAIINLISSGKRLPDGLNTCVYFVLPLSICAGILAMISFLPRTNLPKFLGGKQAGPHPKNLLCYGDISLLPLKTFEQDITARYCTVAQTDLSADYIHDLIVQISVNSLITMRKLKFFRYGMILICLAALVMLIPVLGLAIKMAKGLW